MDYVREPTMAAGREQLVVGEVQQIEFYKLLKYQKYTTPVANTLPKQNVMVVTPSPLHYI